MSKIFVCLAQLSDTFLALTTCLTFKGVFQNSLHVVLGVSEVNISTFKQPYVDTGTSSSPSIHMIHCIGLK
jgi:hypothetical protein